MEEMTAEEKDTVFWHPAFYNAMQLEFKDNVNVLRYQNEYELNRRPIRIDFIVIKKNAEIMLSNELGTAFKRYNIMEYKSENDSMNINVLYKTIGYACLYKAYAKMYDNIDNEIEPDNITISLVRHSKPRELLNYLYDKYKVEEAGAGIYRIAEGFMFPVQIIVGRELDRNSHHWLKSLTRSITDEQIVDLNNATKGLKGEAEIALAADLLEVVAEANRLKLQKSLEEGDDMVRKNLMELLRADIDREVDNKVMELIKNLMTNKHLSANEAMTALGIDNDKIPMYIAML